MDRFTFSKMSVFQSLVVGLSSSSRHRTLWSQEALPLWTARCKLEPVTQNTAFTGSKRIQETPLWECCTSTHRAAVSVSRALSSSLPHSAACTVYPRGMCPCLMLGCTTALWLHVERYCSGKDQNWMLEVRFFLYILKNLNFFLFWLVYIVFYVFTEKQDDIFPVPMLCVVAALLVSVILNVILISMLCKKARRKYLNSGGTIF